MSTVSVDLSGKAPGLEGAAAPQASRWPAVAGRAALALAAVTVAYFVGPTLGVKLPLAAVVILGLGALAVEVFPQRGLEITAGVGVLLLARLNAVYCAYHLALVGTLFLCRRRTWTLMLALAVLAVVVPKTLFTRFYHTPGFYNWLNEPSLAVVIFVTVYWWREARSGRLPVPVREAAPGAPAGPPLPAFAAWAALYFFPTHAANPMVFGPNDLWRGRRAALGPVLQGLALFLGKAGALAALRAAFPHHAYGSFGAAALLAMPRGALWWVVGLNYLDWVLILSGTADLALLFARLYGWPLPSPFRWVLLAWNPVELWRRWGIYNRRFLLKTVYFPLGGNTRHRLLNVMATFLASALVLHSGWFGSKYWEVGPGGWRDQTIYFAVQGLVVCACLTFWQLTGKAPDSDRHLRWSWSRVPATVATQAMSALVHVIVLPQAVPFPDRWRLIGRCLALLQ
jgi:hypothetical protein